VAAGTYSLTARATNDKGDTDLSDPVSITVNALPSVSLTSPSSNAAFKAPANIPLAVQVADTDGSIANVEYFYGTTLITSLSAPPYSFVWTEVPQGTYALTARVTDNLGGAVTSVAVNVTVTAAEAKLYYIHVDHLNSPRAVYDDQQQLRWKWEQAEPFGVNVPDENPSGLGTFELPLRLPGQYYDRETARHQNKNRDYDPSGGRYIQSDPLGLRAGLNTYAYGLSSPLLNADPEGLDVTLYCRAVGGTGGRYSHCFVHVTCPAQGIDEVLSLFGKFPYGIGGLPSVGFKSSASPMEGGALRDDPNAPDQYKAVITPQPTNCDCGYEKSVVSRFYNAPAVQSYGGTASNSNTFAQDLITSPAYGTSWPPGAPSNAVGTLPISVGRIR
jgi:RHS repeat-associated protein